MVNEAFNLDERYEWAGLWWLPVAPQDRVPGVLVYEPGRGLALTLIGAFEDRIMSEIRPGVTAIHEGSHTWDVLHGVAEQREITLLGCIPTSSKRTLGGRVKSPDNQTVEADSALIGVHADDEDEALFGAAQVSVENLGHWAAADVFSGSIGVPKGDRPDGSGSVSVRALESVSVVVDGITFSLGHRRSGPSFDKRRGGTTGRIRDTAYVEMTPPEACSLRAATEFVKSIQDLISLATHRAAGVLWLRLKLTDLGPGAERHPAERSIDVLYSPAAVGERDAKAIEAHRSFFTCDAIPFEVVIPRWCDVRLRLRAATNLILALRYTQAQYLESTLLMAVGAAEALHRGLRIDERPMPDADFKSMRQAMLELAPEDHRDRLRGLIRNDMTLRDRLHALAGRLDPHVIAGLVPDVTQWAGRTVRARNDLAHEGGTPNHSVDELLAVVEVSTAIVILNLLNELGLSAELQREIVQEHPQMRYTARRGREQFSSAAD